MQDTVSGGQDRFLGLKRLRSGKSRTKMPKAGGKPHCRCGYRIRGSKEDHEAGPHHNGKRTGHA